MHFRIQHRYDAAPARVFAMLIDPEFLDSMFTGPQDLPHKISVTGAHTVLRVDSPAPRQVKRYVGDTLHVTMDLNWSDQTEADGSRSGPFRVTVLRTPTGVNGTATIAPDGDGTTVTYDGEFTVRVPVLGTKMEKMASPQVTRVLDVQQEAGRAWLAAH